MPSYLLETQEGLIITVIIFIALNVKVIHKNASWPLFKPTWVFDTIVHS